MRRILIALIMVTGLASCAGEPVWAPDEEVSRASFATGGQPMLSLYTVINVNSGNGGHTALLISAPSQRVLFDPAGSFNHPRLPERNDVVFGMSDRAVAFFADFHSRTSWRVVKQDLPVSPAVAEMALRLAKENGAVPKAFCANATSRLLAQLPGFENISTTMFPVHLMDNFAEYPVTRVSEYHDDDPDNNGTLRAPAL
ncbi:MAG: hypothetical protein CR993_05295 [Rhodobacterales bacterium]|nr:MAG: hypothetical protein CR993_05295 [Rhodobacterales bacterium]